MRLLLLLLLFFSLPIQAQRSDEKPIDLYGSWILSYLYDDGELQARVFERTNPEALGIVYTIKKDGTYSITENIEKSTGGRRCGNEAPRFRKGPLLYDSKANKLVFWNRNGSYTTSWELVLVGKNELWIKAKSPFE